MIAQYAAAGIVSDLKRLAVPASVDSIPSSAMQEDHVSMGWAAGLKLRRAIDGLRRVLAIELLTAARALDLRTAAPGPWDGCRPRGAARRGAGPRTGSHRRCRDRGGRRAGCVRRRRSGRCRTSSAR